ncbi:MAG TPA: dual specificity protein phosphatase family protein [Candidatus Binataceae bacterium]
MDWFTKRPEHERRIVRSSARPSVSEISEELLIGEYPAYEDIRWLKDVYNIGAVHNLQDDEDLRLHGLTRAELQRNCEALGIKFVNTPIQDGSADAMAQGLKPALDQLHKLVLTHRRVYLHCNAGLNRAPTLAIAFLRAYRGMSLNEALAVVKKQRACGPFMTVLEEHFGPRDLKPDK